MMAEAWSCPIISIWCRNYVHTRLFRTSVGNLQVNSIIRQSSARFD
jgi:hypothetical protein